MPYLNKLEQVHLFVQHRASTNEEEKQDQDDTDPALRLHSHNRNTPRNIGINESVLAPDELREQRASSMMATRSLIKEETENQSEYEDVIEAIIVEKASKSRSGSARREHSTLSRRVDERIEPNERKFYTADGIPLVAIKLKQYREVLSIADVRLHFCSVSYNTNIW
jgi:hypothetical protein